MPKQLQREWTSPIYQFFDPVQDIRIIDGQRVHKFKCSAHGCKARIRHYLDTKDSRSTGNKRRHVKSCWGNDVAQAANDAKDVQHVRKHVIKGILQNGDDGEAVNNEGWVDEVDRMTAAERRELRESIQPLKLALIKVGNLVVCRPAAQPCSPDPQTCL